MKKIKTFAAACKAIGIDSNLLPIVEALPRGHQRALIAHYKLVIITQALNEGWVPDWSDNSQLKYYPWFRFVPGSGFAFVDFGYGSSRTRVGSHLCFKSEELAEYAGKQFVELYNEYYQIA